MEAQDKHKLANDLLEQLQPLVLADTIDVLAQMMIRIGVGVILKDFPELQPENGNLAPEEVLELVAIDKRNGESLGGALAHQGLIMLLWLNQSGESNEYDRE